MSCIPIAGIKEYRRSEPIEIRVIKKWVPSKKRKWAPYIKRPKLCYLFVDIHGDAIEATTCLDDEAYYDSIITVQSCYIVNKYISRPQKKHMPSVPHKASIVFGRKASFAPITNCNIPHHYYNFADFKVLEIRMRPKKMLTDYIGRIEKNEHTTTRSGKKLKKITIQDERENLLEITFRPRQSSLIADDVEPGEILLITSTVVKKYKGSPRLVTTPATTVVLNPTSVDTASHVYRLQQLPKMTAMADDKNTVTIAQLLTKNVHENSNGYTCLATVKDIQVDRDWYYALCSKCPKKLYPQLTSFVCADHYNIYPRFRYRVIATITDDTSIAKAVLFDKAMTSLLNIKCQEMITTHGYTDQQIIPTPMLSIIGVTKLMTVTLKAGLTVAVKSIAKPTTHGLMNTPTFALPPATPAAKTNPAKRLHHESTDMEAYNKRQKP